MKIFVSSFLLMITLLLACSKVPVTGRKQINMLPESMLVDMAITSYADLLKGSTVKTASSQDAQMITKVGKKISSAVERYLKRRGNSKRTKGYKWEFNLIEDKMVNAWAMPGGKVAFYTGILAITKTEAGVAVVMGHEIAHAVARHGNERMSQGLMAQTGGIALGVALSEKSKETQDLFMTAYGIGAQVGMMLPFSRKHESEADHMGLIFMAVAGYDPMEAVSFWERMKANSGGAPPEFLSTHPSHANRIADLKKWMPKANAYLKKYGSGKAVSNP